MCRTGHDAIVAVDTAKNNITSRHNFQMLYMPRYMSQQLHGIVLARETVLCETSLIVYHHFCMYTLDHFRLSSSTARESSGAV